MHSVKVMSPKRSHSSTLATDFKQLLSQLVAVSSDKFKTRFEAFEEKDVAFVEKICELFDS